MSYSRGKVIRSRPSPIDLESGIIIILLSPWLFPSNRVVGMSNDLSTRGEGRHQKSRTTKDLGWKCHFEKDMSLDF